MTATSVVIPMVGLIHPESPTSILIAFLVYIKPLSALVLAVYRIVLQHLFYVVVSEGLFPVHQYRLR